MTKAPTIRPEGHQRETFLPLLPDVPVSERHLLVIWAAYTAVLGTIVLVFHRIGDYAVETDFYWSYAPHAREILSGKLTVDQFKGPGYELVLALVGAMTGDLFRGGVLLSLASAVLVLLLTYRLLSTLWDRETGFLVCIALALNTTFLTSAYTASTDMFFNLLAVAAVSLLARSASWSWKSLVLAGLVTGYAYITRYNAISFTVAGVIGILFLSAPDTPSVRRWVGVAAFLGALLLVVVPWMLYTKSQTGTYFFNNNFFNIAYEMYGKGQMTWDEYWANLSPRFRSYADVVAYDPGRFFSRIGLNGAQHFWKDVTLLISPPVGVLALGGLVALVIGGVTRQQGIFLLFSVTFYGVLLPVFYGERFSLYLAPTVLLLSVLFLRWKRIPLGQKARGGARALLLAGVLLYAGVTSVQRVSTEINSGPEELLEVRTAYRALYGQPEKGAKLATRKPHVAYYLDMEFLPFPFVETMESLRTELRAKGATHLYYGVVEAGMRPQFRFLLNPRQAPPDFEAMLQVNTPPAVLYRLRNPSP